MGWFVCGSESHWIALGEVPVTECIRSGPIQYHVHKAEKPTQRGAWTAIAGGAAGGVIGHLWKGLSRSDLKDLGEALDEGDAALIVIGESKIDERIEEATKRAKKVIEKQIDADADELKRQVEAAGTEGA